MRARGVRFPCVVVLEGGFAALLLMLLEVVSGMPDMQHQVMVSLHEVCVYVRERVRERLCCVCSTLSLLEL